MPYEESRSADHRDKEGDKAWVISYILGYLARTTPPSSERISYNVSADANGAPLSKKMEQTVPKVNFA